MKQVILYSEGWKYRLEAQYEDVIPLRPPESIKTDYVVLLHNGYFVIRKGFAWDGPSGPAIDTATFMRASMVHDSLYGLLRSGLLPAMFKDQADVLLRVMCIEDGMNPIRAWWVYTAVKTFAKRATTPEGESPILTAP